MPERPESPGKIPVSILVLTCNEEANIAACLESLRWADEIFVVDSLSTDRTVETAERFRAKVYSHPFEGYATQRNWALDHLPFSHDWVLVIDADERVPAALASEIHRVLANPQRGHDGYYLKRRFFFLGVWLRHGGLYPIWLLRLFKRRAVRFEERPMNEHVIIQGMPGYLSQALDHRDLRPLTDWIAKHNRYADLEVEEYFQERFGEGYRDAILARLWGTQAQRKRWIKRHIWNHLPLLVRPFLLFVRNFFFKAGFLDGKPGFVYHVLWSFWYPFLIGIKILERERAFQAHPSSQSLFSQEGGANVASPVPESVGWTRHIHKLS